MKAEALVKFITKFEMRIENTKWDSKIRSSHSRVQTDVYWLFVIAWSRVRGMEASLFITFQAGIS